MDETTPFDPADVLTDRASILAYLDEAFATGDSDFVEDALAVAARASGVEGTTTDGPADAGGSDADPALDGHPPLASVLRVLKALGVRLSVCAAE